MSESYRLKVKLGDYEFDAEGPHDVVQAQFEAFQGLVTSIPRSVPAPTPPVSPLVQEETSNGIRSNILDVAAIDAALSTIMKVENRIVSLTVPPKAVDDAVLLVLYGQKMMRNNESVTGGEIVDGLTATGGLDVGRSDRLLERVARNGDVIMIGERRGKRYRLTNAGANKARQVAASLIALVS